MLTYFAQYSTHTDSWHVCYRVPHRPWPTSVCDCNTEGQAEAEARRLNQEARRQQAAVARAAERRPVAGFYTGQGDM